MNLSCKPNSAFLRGGLLFLFFLSTCCLLTAQDLSPSDTLNIKNFIQEQVQLEVKQQLSWFYWIFGIAAGVLTLWAIATWFYRIRKVAEQQINLKTAAIIDTKISEKIGVKTDLIRSYFQRLEEEQALFLKRILVVNAQAGKRQPLENILKKAGFQTIPIFWTIDQFWEKVEPNNFDLILFDNEDGLLEESDITACIDKYSSAFKFVCFTSRQWGQENYQRYNASVKFVKDSSYLGDAVRNALDH